MMHELGKHPARIVYLFLACLGLAIVFLFQDFDILASLDIQAHPYVHFVVRKTLRLVVNDLFMVLFIYAWFYTPTITSMAWKLQLIDTFILLPIYLVLKLLLEGDGEISSPLLSQLHRLIINPTLLVLYIPAVYFQQLKEKRN